MCLGRRLRGLLGGTFHVLGRLSLAGPPLEAGAKIKGNTSY